MTEEPIQPQPAISEDSPPKRKMSLPVPVPVVAGGVFGVLLLAGLMWMARRPPPPPPAAPSEESLAYLSNVTVSDYHLSIADNMVGSVIVYLDGLVNNKGDRVVRYLRVRLYFYDSLSQLILRVERDIVTPDGAPLPTAIRAEMLGDELMRVRGTARMLHITEEGIHGHA